LPYTDNYFSMYLNKFGAVVIVSADTALKGIFLCTSVNLDLFVLLIRIHYAFSFLIKYTVQL